MPILNLDRDEVDRLVNIVANAPVPWVVSNPLLQKISQQAQAEAPRRGRPPQGQTPLRNGAEAQSHEPVTHSEGT